MKEKGIIGRLVIILSVALLLIQSESGVQRVSATKPALAEMTDLNNLDQLKEVFQRDRDKVRLVSLLSPV